MAKVKGRGRQGSRISSKHQVTIPIGAMRDAGLEAGQRVVAHAAGPGRVVLEREDDPLVRYAGILTGTYRPNEVAELRGEWD